MSKTPEQYSEAELEYLAKLEHETRYFPPVADRDNTAKVDLSLLPPKALIAEAQVWGFGTEKYGRANWKKLWGDKTIEVALASGLRHMVAMMDGEMRDPESRLWHAAHVRCNMAMIIEYLTKETI